MAFHKTYGRQGTLKLDRQMGREDRSGLRADVGLSYDDAGAMGPGTHEPSVDYHNLHRIRAQTAPVASSWYATQAYTYHCIELLLVSLFAPGNRDKIHEVL